MKRMMSGVVAGGLAVASLSAAVAADRGVTADLETVASFDEAELKAWFEDASAELEAILADIEASKASASSETAVASCVAAPAARAASLKEGVEKSGASAAIASGDAARAKSAARVMATALKGARGEKAKVSACLPKKDGVEGDESHQFTNQGGSGGKETEAIELDGLEGTGPASGSPQANSAGG